MEIMVKKVPAGDGLSWWLDSWSLIKSHLLFTLGMGVLMLLPEAIGQIPFVGGAIEAFFAAMLGVGSMEIFAGWSRGEKVRFRTLFRAFADRALFKRVLPFCLLLVALGFLADLVMVGEQAYSNPDFWVKHTFKFNLAPFSLFLYFIMFCVYAVYMTVLQFFLPLVYFANTSLKQATRLAWDACVINWAALLVNVFAGVALLAIAALPMGLGILVFLPMMLALPFVMYKGLFSGPA